MHHNIKIMALAGIVAAAIALPQKADASTSLTCRQEYQECIAAGGEVSTCRDEYLFCVGLLPPVRVTGIPMTPAKMHD